VLSRFFIDRPIFATVLSLLITLAGALSLYTLPLALYPPISPPVVQVECNYAGADACVVAETVAAPIEQQVNGVEGMMYMASQSGNDGSYNLTITFQNGVDQNLAQVLVQNRVNLAIPQLPEVIRKTIVTTRKKPPDILLSVNLCATDSGRYDQLYLSNYALIQVRDELVRVPGVSDVTQGSGAREYSMRIWVDPDRLASRHLSAGDVVAAIREQNAETAVGHIGQEPVAAGQPTQVPLATLGRLSDVEQFEHIVIKTGHDGRLTRLKDVARVELGAKTEDITCHLDGKPSSSLTVWQLPGANALVAADLVKAKLEELKKSFPPGIDYVVRYDTTPYIRESIQEVLKTLRDAILLVALVVLVFLQNWRSAVIPLVAVPVAIIGTFAVMAALGFSLNNLTLFGLVLAIGIVVDDAIVVVEAVEHHIQRGLSPRAATLKAMEDVSGPVIAVGLVLSAVFFPCAFISGITGLFFRQFALTIAVSTLLSALNSLTLSPALTALLLRSRKEEEERRQEPLPRFAFLFVGAWLAWLYLAPPLQAACAAFNADLFFTPAIPVLIGATVGWGVSRWLNRALGWLFRLFNLGFDAATGYYTRLVGHLLRVSAIVLVVYAGLVFLTQWGLRTLPKGFIPSQDMGYLVVNAQLPDAASEQRAADVMARAEQIVMQTRGIKHVLAVTGESFLLGANDSNFGSMFVILDDFDQRRDPELSGESIAATLRRQFKEQMPGAEFAVLGPPPVRGIGRGGGFKVMIEDRGDLGFSELQEQADRLTETAAQQPELVGLSSIFRANVPQLLVDVDRKGAMQKHVPLKEINDALEVYLGSLYVNDFNRFGRTWQVIVQSEGAFRSQEETFGRLRVRSARGKMVPLGSLAHVRAINGPLIVTRYNMYPAAFISGTAAPGVSSGQAIARVQELAQQQLPRAMTYEWTETAYLELQAGNTALLILGLSVAMVFLVLAALYESWSLPLAVILVVPLCVLSSIAGVAVAGMDINILTQVGFVVLVGLASKNAILIVEFAKREREAGVPRRGATLAACKLRLRPIVMTSLAFILGVVPLMVSRGAGAEMRRTLGTAVFSGMVGVTLVGIFLTPVFFYVINGLRDTRPFTSPSVELVGVVLLDVTTLGLRRLPSLLRRSREALPVERPLRVNVAQEPSRGPDSGDYHNGRADSDIAAEEPVPLPRSGAS
jgi:multidrug efflux pump subunit AcrB